MGTGSSLLAAATGGLSLQSNSNIDISSGVAVAVRGTSLLDLQTLSGTGVTSLTTPFFTLTASQSIMGTATLTSLYASSFYEGAGAERVMTSTGPTSLAATGLLTQESSTGVSLYTTGYFAAYASGITSLGGETSMIVSGGGNFVDIIANNHVNIAGSQLSFYTSGEQDHITPGNALLYSGKTTSLVAGTGGNVLLSAGDAATGNLLLTANTLTSFYTAGTLYEMSMGNAAIDAALQLSLYGGSSLLAMSQGVAVHSSASHSMYTTGSTLVTADGNLALVGNGGYTSIQGANSFFAASTAGMFLLANTGALSLGSDNAIAAYTAGNAVLAATSAASYLSLYGGTSVMLSADNSAGTMLINGGTMVSIYSATGVYTRAPDMIQYSSGGGSYYTETDLLAQANTGTLSLTASAGNAFISGANVEMATAGNVVVRSSGGAASLTSTAGVYISSTSATNDAYLLSSANLQSASTLMTSLYSATDLFAAAGANFGAAGGNLLSVYSGGSMYANTAGFLYAMAGNAIQATALGGGISLNGAGQIITMGNGVSTYANTDPIVFSGENNIALLASSASDVSVFGMNFKATLIGAQELKPATYSSLATADVYTYASNTITADSPLVTLSGNNAALTPTYILSSSSTSLALLASADGGLSVTGAGANLNLHSAASLLLSADNAVHAGNRMALTANAYMSLHGGSSLHLTSAGVTSLSGPSSVYVQGGSTGSPGFLFLESAGGSGGAVSVMGGDTAAMYAGGNLLLTGVAGTSIFAGAPSGGADIWLQAYGTGNVWAKGTTASTYGSANFFLGAPNQMVYGDSAVLSLHSAANMAASAPSGALSLTADTLLSSAATLSAHGNTHALNGHVYTVTANSLYMAAGAAAGMSPATGAGPLSIYTGVSNEVFLGAVGAQGGASFHLSASNVAQMYGDLGVGISSGGIRGLSLLASTGSLYAVGAATSISGASQLVLAANDGSTGGAVSITSLGNTDVSTAGSLWQYSASSITLRSVDNMAFRGSGDISLGATVNALVYGGSTTSIMSTATSGSLFLGPAAQIVTSTGATATASAGILAYTAGAYSVGAGDSLVHTSGASYSLASAASARLYAAGNLEVTAGTGTLSLGGGANSVLIGGDAVSASQLTSLYSKGVLAALSTGALSLGGSSTYIGPALDSQASGTLSTYARNTYMVHDALFYSNAAGGTLIDTPTGVTSLFGNSGVQVVSGASAGSGVILASAAAASVYGASSYVLQSDTVGVLAGNALLIGSSSTVSGVSIQAGSSPTGVSAPPAGSNPGVNLFTNGDFVAVSNSKYQVSSAGISFAAGAGVGTTGFGTGTDGYVDMTAGSGYFAILAKGNNAYLGSQPAYSTSLYGGNLVLAATGTAIGTGIGDFELSGTRNGFLSMGGANGASFYTDAGPIQLVTNNGNQLLSGNTLSLVGTNSLVSSFNTLITQANGNLYLDTSGAPGASVASIYLGGVGDPSAKALLTTPGLFSLNAATNLQINTGGDTSFITSGNLAARASSIYIGDIPSGQGGNVLINAAMTSITGSGSFLVQSGLASFYTTSTDGIQAYAKGGLHKTYGENMILNTNQVSTTSNGFMSLGSRNMILSAPNYLSLYTGYTTGSEYRLETGYGVHSATFTHSIVAGLTLELESYGDIVMLANQPKSATCTTCGFVSIQGAASAFLVGGTGTTGDVYVQGGRYASVYATTLATVTADASVGTASLSAAYAQASGINSIVVTSPAITSVFGGTSLALRSNNFAGLGVAAATGGALLAHLSLYANNGGGAFGLLGNDFGAVSATGLVLAGQDTVSLYATSANDAVYLKSGGSLYASATGPMVLTTPSSLYLATTSAASPMSLYAAGEAYVSSGTNQALLGGATVSITAGTEVYLQAPGSPNTQLRLASGEASIIAATRVQLAIQDASAADTARVQLGGSDASALNLYAASTLSLHGAGGLVGSAPLTGAVVSFTGTNVWAGASSFATVSASDLLGAVSITSAATYLGGGSACTGTGASTGAGGTGYGCASGGGQVRLPNSGIVFSSRLYLSCASGTPAPTAVQLMNAHLIIVGNNCPSGTVIQLPDMSNFYNTEGWEAVVIYDYKAATAPYLSSPTINYITLQWTPATPDTGFLYAKVAARTAVTLYMYNSDWGGAANSAAYPTYAISGATDQGISTTPKPWLYA